MYQFISFKVRIASKTWAKCLHRRRQWETSSLWKGACD